MSHYRFIYDQNGQPIAIETTLRGRHLIRAPFLNKGSAFSNEERQSLGLMGYFPSKHEDLEEQVDRYYNKYVNEVSDVDKYFFLAQLHDLNETIFYKLIHEHIEEMMPIIYTPTVGSAIPHSVYEYKRQRGIYVNYGDKDQIKQTLESSLSPETRLVVITDGECLLGIGDHGIGGMHIAIAKANLYTLLAGIPPHLVTAIQLDTGTNNPQLLEDSKYLGWQHPRINPERYQTFITDVVETVQSICQQVYIHWEDLDRNNAHWIMDHFGTQLTHFNDDMQGTGASTIATIMAATQQADLKMTDHRVVMFGAGTAGSGIAEQLYKAFLREGLTGTEAKDRIWMIDMPGLLHDGLEDLPEFQKRFARSQDDVSDWERDCTGRINLLEAINQIQPTMLLGASAVQGAFTEEIVRAMHSHVDRPIIMPLSNPPSRAEATPQDLIQWTNGQAIIATGSPHGQIKHGDIEYCISQNNNSYTFPGLGLGVLISGATEVTENMLWAASTALSEFPYDIACHGSLLPAVHQLPKVGRYIAKYVADQAIKDSVATVETTTDWEQELQKMHWNPEYLPIRPSKQ